MIDFYVPLNLNKITDSLKLKVNKLENILGYNLSYYKYCLIDNGFALSKKDDYAKKYLENYESLYLKLPNKLKFLIDEIVRGDIYEKNL